MALHGLPTLANFEGYQFSSPQGTDIATAVGREMDAGLDWEALKRLRDLWPRKLMLKGVERPDDADRAAALGCDGVVVSNHGGRQLDGAEAGIRALPAVVEAVAGRAEVYVDGGIRRGTDVLKAVALGARAVMIGRPYLWGLAAGGERGVRRVLDLMRDELETSMALAGCPAVRAVERSLVGPA
jgi:(S)-mandelate dehydrogenase